MISEGCCRSDTDLALFYHYLCAIDVFVGSFAHNAELAPRKSSGIWGQVRMDFATRSGSAISDCVVALHTKGLTWEVEACRWGRQIKLKTGEAGIGSLRAADALRPRFSQARVAAGGGLAPREDLSVIFARRRLMSI